MNRIVQFSAGLSSLETAFRVAAQHGTDNLTLLFADTLYEHPASYRLLIHGAGMVFGIDAKALAESAMNLPGIAEDEIAARKLALAQLRAEAMALIPGLVWLCDGRTPHEVFFDERFLGNSRTAKCSIVLKREQCDRWHEENCDPAATLVYLGFGFREQGRMESIRKVKPDWTFVFPMDDAPLMDRVQLMQACRDRQIEIPPMYLMGFPHGNCHGCCCQAGQAVWEKTYRYFPKEFGVWQREEERFRSEINGSVSMMTDRRGGEKKPFTLTQLRERVTTGGEIDWDDKGACYCFSAEPAAPDTS